MKLQLVALLLVLAVDVSLAKPNGFVPSKSVALKHIFGVSQPKPSHDATSNGISVALVVQKSQDMVAGLIALKRIVPDVVKQLNDLSFWARTYTFWEFDDKSHNFVGKTEQASDLPTVVTSLIENRRTAKPICTDTQLVDSLIQVLTDETATFGIEVFVYVYGGATLDPAELQTLYKLIAKKGAKIHITQHTGSFLCFNQDPDALELRIIAEIAQHSGGTYSLVGSGATFYSLPFQYNSKIVASNNQERCKGDQEITFNVDSSAWTLAIRLYGDIVKDPTLTGPDGKTVALKRIYGNSYNQVSVIGNPTSSSSKLAAGQYTIKFSPYADDFGDVLPCGLRIDAQSDAQKVFFPKHIRSLTRCCECS